MSGAGGAERHHRDHGHLGNHAHLHVPGHSPLHRLAPEAKLAGLVTFAVVVAVTPRHRLVVFAVYAALVVGAIVAARLPARLVLRRLAVVIPFLGLAVLVPFVAGGDQVSVAGLDLSREGLWSSWNIAAKATLGATASIVFSATTPLPDVLTALTRLRVPVALAAITSFMFRYLDLVADQLRRMRTAMVARAHDPRWLWQAKPVATSMGTLFVRSYERGERTHRAMLARGYTGTMPVIDDRRATPGEWAGALVPAAIALAALVISIAAGGGW